MQRIVGLRTEQQGLWSGRHLDGKVLGAVVTLKRSLTAAHPLHKYLPPRIRGRLLSEAQREAPSVAAPARAPAPHTFDRHDIVGQVGLPGRG